MQANTLPTLTSALLICLAPTVQAAAGPWVDGKFQGRIAYSADGNHNDPDDWAASPLALAIIAQSGHKDRLVHFDYNCILPKTNPEWEKIHGASVLGAARLYGYDLQNFHDCQRSLDDATASIARAIDASTADDPLYFIIAGPVEVPFRGIEQSQPDKRQHVYCISHSRWNDGFATAYQFTHTKRSVIPSGVHWAQITDQNRLLSLSPYGKPGPSESFTPYHWMRDSQDERVRFLWERLLVSTRPDPSDAGMAYFLVTGDEQADPQKLQRLLDDKIAPQPIATRKHIRLEAENFRELNGFEVEDRNDRAASHRLAVQSTGRSPASIKTFYNEPYAPADGRFDATVRFLAAAGEGKLSLQVNGVETAQAQLNTGEQGWQSIIFRNMAIATGDMLSIVSENPEIRIDYLQLDLR